MQIYNFRVSIILTAVWLILVSCTGWAGAPLCRSVFERPTFATDQNSYDPGLSVVVPVYRELQNGNLYRLLYSFSKQSSSTKVDLVLIVNNTLEIAESRNPIWQENQMTLELLSEIKSGDFKSGKFSSAQWKNLAKSLREKKINIHVIDLSTNGIERNIGLIRDIGLKAVTQTKQPEHLVAMLDADSIVSSNYVASIKASASRDGSKTLFLGLEHFPEPNGSKDLYNTFYREQYWYEWENIWTLLKNRPFDSLASSQIVSTVKNFQKIGGVPHALIREDILVAQKLAQNSPFETLNLAVATADRARDDSYSGARRKKEIEQQIEPGWTHQFIDPVAVLAYNSFKLKWRERLSLTHTEVEKHFDFFKIKVNPAQVIALMIGKNDSSLRDLLGINKNQKVNEFHPAESILHFLGERLTPNEINELQSIRSEEILNMRESMEVTREELRLLIEGLKRNQSPKHRSRSLFARDNLWLEFYLKEKMKDQSTEEVLHQIEMDFPGWLSEVGSCRRDLVELRALGLFFKNVRLKPEKFPIALGLLKMFEQQLNIDWIVK